MESLKLFEKPEFGKVRVVIRNGEPWFVAKDVCACLEISNTSQSCDRLDDDEKGICKNDTLGGKQDLLVVSESGLYSLMLRSNKPEARLFKKWITSEVLPSIRKTGGYAMPSYMIEDPEKRALAWVEEHKQARLALEAKDKEIGTLKAQNGVLSQDYVSNKDVCMQLLAKGLAKKKNGQDYALSTLLSKVSPMLQQLSRENGYSVSEQIVVVEGVERKTPYYHVDVRDMVLDLFDEKRKGN